MEEYEQIRSLITSSANGRGRKVVMVSGPSGREGVSTIAKNIATALATNGNAKVVLVDANLRTPNKHVLSAAEGSLIANRKLRIASRDKRYATSDKRKGLTDLVLDGLDVNEAVTKTIVKNLYLITSGTNEVPAKRGPNDNDPLRVFESPRLKPTLGKLKKKFDYVVLDTPAINKYPDAAILSRYVDAVLLVIEFGRTHREVVQIAQGKLIQNNTNVFAAVLNKRKYFIPDFIYKRL